MSPKLGFIAWLAFQNKGTFGTLNLIITGNKRWCNGINIPINIYGCEIGLKWKICIFWNHNNFIIIIIIMHIDLVCSLGNIIISKVITCFNL